MKKFSNIIKNEFDSKPVHNEKNIKTKIKSYNGKINTNVHNNKIPKEGSHYICLSLIFIDLVYRKDTDYHLQVFLEECKYVVKKRRLTLLPTTKNFLVVLIPKILMKKIRHIIFFRKI